MSNNKNTQIVFIEKEGRTSRLANLKQVLSDKFLIPSFQRPYAWDEGHFKDLLESIKENQKLNRDVFLGSIIVALKEDSDHPVPGKKSKYFIIDGQQRITSFLLLIKFIYNDLKDKIASNQKNLSEIKNLVKIAKDTRDVDSLDKHKDELFKKQTEEKELNKNLEDIKKILTYEEKQKRVKREKEKPGLETTILKYIFSDDSSNKNIEKIKEVFDDEVGKESDIVNIGDFLNYILDKCVFCFLAIKGEDSEGYAIDIFNSLNSTGEPLTAFEILKSLIYKKFEKDSKLQKELNDKFNKIEHELNTIKMKKIKQNQYTDRLLTFINMMMVELQLQKLTTFRDKKKLLDKIYELEKDKIKNCVEMLHSLHEFIFKNWENRKDPLKDYKELEEEHKIIFNFFQNNNHDRVIPVLYYFKDLNLGEAIKLCAAFTCLWRGYSSDGGTDRIDQKYEELINELFEQKYSIDQLKGKIQKSLKDRDKDLKPHLTKDNWVDKFKTVDIYKSKKLARFLLKIAFDRREFSKPSFKKSKLRFLDRLNDWLGKEYKTIEHITPQEYKTIHKIGNLVLLPQKVNSKVRDKNFKDKKKYYEDCVETDPNGMPYIPILKEIVSYNEDNELDDRGYLKEGVIDRRGKKLGESIWKTLAEDWLKWKD